MLIRCEHNLYCSIELVKKGLERQVEGLVGEPLGPLEGWRWDLEIAGHHRFELAIKRLSWNDQIDETDSVCLLGTDILAR